MFLGMHQHIGKSLSRAKIVNKQPFSKLIVTNSVEEQLAIRSTAYYRISKQSNPIVR